MEGSSKLYAKAMQNLPDNGYIAYNYAYHALSEEKNPAKAAGLLFMAAKQGAPTWVYSLAARLYTDAGQKEFAENVLKQAEANNVDEKILNRMKEKINSK